MRVPAKNLKMVSLRYFNPLISKYIKNLFRAFIKNLFKCSKINKLRNVVLPFGGFWPGTPIYTYYFQACEYARVLIILLVLNMSGFWIYHGSKYARVTHGS